MNYAELLAAYDKIELERDQLKARVQELEEWIRLGDGGYTNTLARNIKKQLLLNRQPAQSLALHDAEVLEEAADWFDKEYNDCNPAATDLRFELAAQLRKEAGE